jgi:hypothetical protein
MMSNRRGRGNAAKFARGIGVTKLKAELGDVVVIDTRILHTATHVENEMRHLIQMTFGEPSVVFDDFVLGFWRRAFRRVADGSQGSRFGPNGPGHIDMPGSTQITLSLWLVGPFEGGR